MQAAAPTFYVAQATVVVERVQKTTIPKEASDAKRDALAENVKNNIDDGFEDGTCVGIDGEALVARLNVDRDVQGL